MSIDSLESLREHLQTAIRIEWSTIPPYLCALWSLGDTRNRAAADCLRDVVTEEMLHLTLAANVLNALGGEPDLTDPPRYPGPLPHSDRSFEVALLPFCPEALETFRRIEHPALIGSAPQDDDYTTIAQFYEAVGIAVAEIGRDPAVWTHRDERQVQPNREYYNGGGDVIAVDGVDSALRAVAEIIEEGEGYQGGVFDGDDLAHYFRFDELARGRRYVQGDTPDSGPTGGPILVDYGAVKPMRPNPSPHDYPPGSELREMTEECDATYARLLSRLQAAFTGSPHELAGAVRDMWALEYQALALMNVPAGDGLVAGPAFTPPRG